MIKVEMEITPPNYRLVAFLVTKSTAHRLSNSEEPSCRDAIKYIEYWRNQAREIQINFELGDFVNELCEDILAGDEKFLTCGKKIWESWKN